MTQLQNLGLIATINLLKGTVKPLIATIKRLVVTTKPLVAFRTPSKGNSPYQATLLAIFLQHQ